MEWSTVMSYGLLMDVGSIQSFIFGSNKLQENIGASWLIEDLFGKSFLSEVNQKGTVVFSGGGNCLITFPEKQDARDFLFLFTSKLLVEVPGITIHAAIEPYNEKSHEQDFQNLHTSLLTNKGKEIPVTQLTRHGINLECPRTGLSTETFISFEKNEGKWVNSSVAARLNKVDEANERLTNFFVGTDKKNQLLVPDPKTRQITSFEFTTELDKLGQEKGEENSIAIVHIDGNSMGDRFKACKSKEELTNLSVSVSEATKAALVEMTLNFIDAYFKGDFNDLKLRRGKADSSLILPFRPLILGGDDITFVSDGRLGIWLAQAYITSFSQKIVSDKKPLSSCAGIAITKTKFPFFRGYELAERLCSSAKKRARDVENSSWLDWQILFGHGSFDFDELRNHHFTLQNGKKLFGRPYRADGNATDNKSMKLIIEKAEELRTKWPNNKIKELRSALASVDSDRIRFIETMKARGLYLPDYQNEMKSTGFSGDFTIYNDVIELLDIYPFKKKVTIK